MRRWEGWWGLYCGYTQLRLCNCYGQFVKMIKIILILVLLISQQLSAQACDCSMISNLNKARKAALADADLVFVGRVVSTGENFDYTYQGWFNNKIFEIEVTESFKGTKTGIILKGHALTSCSGHPDKGIWLIYANIDENGMIMFSTCSLSRSFHEPQQIFFEGYTPRPPTKEETENPKANNDLDWPIEIATIHLQAAKDLKTEITWLRTTK